nr:Abi family protein [uncultured Catonella sp.]
MQLKQPLSFEEQLDKIKSHGIIVNDKQRVIEKLEQINYYRLTGYALQFRVEPNKSEYVVGTTFENIYKLYIVDEKLRNLCRIYIEKAEIHNQHYDRNNFYNKSKYDEVMENLKKEKNYYKDSLVVKHHMCKYPLTVYNPVIRFIFTVIIPIGFISYFPIIQMKNIAWVFVLGMAASGVLLIVSVYLFEKAFRLYESTGS